MGNFLPSEYPDSPAFSPSESKKELRELIEKNKEKIEEVKRHSTYNTAKLKHCETEALKNIRDEDDVQASKWLERKFYCELKKKQLDQRLFEFETQKKKLLGIDQKEGIHDSIDLMNNLLSLEKEVLKDEGKVVEEEEEPKKDFDEKRSKNNGEVNPIERIEYIEEGLKRLKRTIVDERYK